ncbi:VanZ family protein [Streptomyces sp. NPDC047023]|uniref:VanZ family protein n=1 Tax=Streptomyces sp. NPDC047023 TaxID=3155139 RepID=UPI0033E35C69
MIEASMDAVPGLMLGFCILALVLGVPAAVFAHRNTIPAIPAVLSAVCVAGIVCVTLLPGLSADAGRNFCDLGFEFAALGPSAWLNFALFIPAPLFAAVASRKPLLTVAAAVVGSAAIEAAQTRLATGRTCSLTDLVMNSAGALTGTAVALVWLAAAASPALRWKRDAALSAITASVGFVLLTAVLAIWTPDTRNAVASDRETAAMVAATEEAVQWMGEVSTAAFGPNQQNSGIRTEQGDGRWMLAFQSDSGTIDGVWPDRTLTSIKARNNEAGTLTASDATAAGKTFPETWFPDPVRGSTLTTQPLGTSPRTVYELTYRRHANGVMLPMRLDLAVTSTGRILHVSCVPEPDPTMPTPVLNRETAATRARALTRRTPTAAVLLAQKIGGIWRPVWMVGMPEGSPQPDVFLDAVTGTPVTPDHTRQPPRLGSN